MNIDKREERIETYVVYLSRNEAIALHDLCEDVLRTKRIQFIPVIEAASTDLVAGLKVVLWPGRS